MKNNDTIEQFKTIFNILRKSPIIITFAIIFLLLTLLLELFSDNEIIVIMQLIGIGIGVALCAAILVIDKDAKKHLKRVALYSIFWFISCIALVDFNKLTLKLVAQLSASLIFIFLGCLLPDLISNFNTEKDKSEKKLCEIEERLSKIEKKFEDVDGTNHSDNK